MPTPAPDVAITKEVQSAVKALAPAVKRLAAVVKKLKPEKLTIGAATDLLYQLRLATSALNAITRPLADDVISPAVKQLEEFFIATLAVGEASGVQGRTARVQVTDSLVPSVEDWPVLYKYIRRTGAWELLQRSVSKEAVRERWDQKRQVPGVKAFHVKRVSCTRLGNGKGN